MDAESSEAPEQAAPAAADREQRNGEGEATLRRRELPFLSKLSLASHIYGLKGVLGPLLWIRDWAEYFDPPPGTPNIVKTYECRVDLPVRCVFVPVLSR